MTKNLVRERRTELKGIRIQIRVTEISRTRIITSARTVKVTQIWWLTQIQVIKISARIPVFEETSEIFAQIASPKLSKP